MPWRARRAPTTPTRNARGRDHRAPRERRAGPRRERAALAAEDPDRRLAQVARGEVGVVRPADGQRPLVAAGREQDRRRPRALARDDVALAVADRVGAREVDAVVAPRRGATCRGAGLRSSWSTFHGATMPSGWYGQK